MRLRKFEHACFTITKNNETIVIDPGQLSKDFVVPATPVVAIIVTHIHPDHLSSDWITSIQALHPSAQVIAHSEVIAVLDASIANTMQVAPGDVWEHGAFHIEFSGGEHATIHELAPRCANLGVLINGAVYYPGDSFTVPKQDVAVLALPIAAPWMKTSEAMEYLMQLCPAIAFPTHDAILSDSGKRFNDNWMNIAAAKVGTNYQRLHESLDIDA